MAARNFQSIADLLDTKAVGQRVESLEVRGINALKTVEPPTAALAGQRVLRVAVDDPVIEITCDSIAIQIDLARTGTVDLLDSAATSAASPTGVLVLQDGTKLAFSEPARTKRIAFTLIVR